MRFASVVYTHELIGNDFGVIRLPLYLGAPEETGNAWANKGNVNYNDLR